MPFNWKEYQQQQLAGMPNNTGAGVQAVSNLPQPNMPQSSMQNMQQQQSQLRTGKNPNPKYPRARDKWEKAKELFGKWANFQYEQVAGKPGGVEQYSTSTPEQQSIMQLLQQLGVYGLQNPDEGFEPIAQQALDQFNNEGLNSIAHRFTSLGEGGLDSPDFAQHAYGARVGLMKDLAAQKAQWGQNNMQNILQMLQLGLGRQSENVYRPEQPGFAKEAAMAAIKALVAGG